MGNGKDIAGRESKPHIGIFGRCNSGKSSLLNFIVGADTAIVSPESGTTTDVVRKGYEIRGFAPVIFIDTAGIDDESVLGRRRVARTMETMAQIDLALLVFREWGDMEIKLAGQFESRGIPYIPVYNISSESLGVTPAIPGGQKPFEEATVTVDATKWDDGRRDLLLEAIKAKLPESSYSPPGMFGNRANRGDVVLLICPIDGEAPAGRMILPQVQAIRELLDRHAVPVVVQPAEIPRIFAEGLKPILAVADSQVLSEVRAVITARVELTSFSILLAAAKGDYELFLKGLDKADDLKDGDSILIAESCTHQVGCEDIGRVRIPAWLEEYSGRKLRFTVVSGLSPLPDDLPSYAMVVQCGGCMATRSQLRNRIRQAAEAGVPMTNYGMLIRKIRK